MVKRDVFTICMYLMVVMALAFMNKLTLFFSVLLLLISPLFIHKIVRTVLRYRDDCSDQQKLYTIMLHMTVHYRHTRRLADLLEGCIGDRFKALDALHKQGNCIFEGLYDVYSHYLYVYIVTLIEMDVRFGDDSIVDALYQVEGSIDRWNQSIRLYQCNLMKQLKKMGLLIGFALVLSHLILTMMGNILPIQNSVVYQVCIFVFLILMQGFLVQSLTILKKGCVFNHEILS